MSNPSNSLSNSSSQQPQEVMFDRLFSKFSSEILEQLIIEISNGRLEEEGRVRNYYKKEIEKILNNNLNERFQIKLLLEIGKKLQIYKEIILAREFFSQIVTNPLIERKSKEILENSNNNNNNFESKEKVQTNNFEVNHQNNKKNNNNEILIELEILSIEATHGLIQCDYLSIIQNPNNLSHISPMSTSQILSCITRLRQSIDRLLDLSPSYQEKYAYLILNSVKLIYSYGKPLIWLGCGKYIYESFIYATLSMDSVINLCTARHLSLKMKLTSCAFIAILTYGTIDEARGISYT